MIRFVLLALTLSACSAPTSQPQAEAPAAQASAAPSLDSMPSWETARAAGVDFRAVGQEPGWMADIYTDGRVQIVWDYGDKSAAFTGASPSYPREGSTQYDVTGVGHTLRVVTQRFPCQDAMSGEAYPARVVVTIDGRTLEGCGKSV
jgi:uncharacterized membrane protein